MAFEAFPRDSCQAYEDSGLYYVNEKGKLRSPPGLGRGGSSSGDWPSLGQSPPGINGIFQDKRHRSVTVETCYDGSTRNVYHPKKLFDVSLMFVADNIGLVESFAGFPEIVGEQLFNTAMELGKFGDGTTKQLALRLFYEAYGGVVLESLTLRDEPTVLSEHLDCIALFTGLRALDLGGCGLGNDADHDVLAVIGNMYSLQELCLCDNGLNDGSIQKMTTPVRMLGRGPKSIQALDLSGNALLTNRGAKYLCAFTSLRILDLSGTSISTQGITRIQSKIPSLRAADTTIKRSRFPISVSSTGWAVPLVHIWIWAPKAIKTQGTTKSSAASAFYGKVLVIPTSTVEDPASRKKRLPVIQLVADDPNLLTFDPSTTTFDPTAATDDILPPPTKRLKQSVCEQKSTNIIGVKKTLLETRTNQRDSLVENLSLRNQFSKLKHKDGKHSAGKTERKIGIKSSKTKSNSSALPLSGKGKGMVDEETGDEDLMRSYLEARSKAYGGGTTGGSLMNAMSSHGW